MLGTAMMEVFLSNAQEKGFEFSSHLIRLNFISKVKIAPIDAMPCAITVAQAAPATPH